MSQLETGGTIVTSGGAKHTNINTTCSKHDVGIVKAFNAMSAESK